MHYSNPWQYYANPYYVQYPAANPYHASQHYSHAQAAPQSHTVAHSFIAAGKGTASLIKSEWGAQFGPTLIFMIISAGILWFKIYGGRLVGDKAQAELLQTGIVAAAVIMFISIAVNILGMSSGISASDMIWIHMALVLITCVLMWNHVAHLVAIHARPPPEDDKKTSSSRSSSSRSSASSSSSSSRSKSSSSRDPAVSSSRSAGSSSSTRPSSTSSSGSSSSRAPSSSTASNGTASSSSRAAGSSSSGPRPSASSISSSSRSSPSSGSISSRPEGDSSTSASRSSSSKEKDKPEEEEENPDPWGKAHPSSKLTKGTPRIWPFPIGFASVASKKEDGKQRLWWESGMPHEVGYICRGDSQNLETILDPNDTPRRSSSKDKSSPSSGSSIPPPTSDERDELKAIMKGDKQLSKDKTTKARQKELMKMMMAKKSETSTGDSSSTRGPPIGLSSRSVSSAPITTSKPSVEELAELKSIMKGEKQFSEDKTKERRQKELIKLMMARRDSRSELPAQDPMPKKGVRFDDEGLSEAALDPRFSSRTSATSPVAEASPNSSSSRFSSASRSADPQRPESHSSSSSRRDSPSGRIPPADPSSSPAASWSSDKLAQKRKTIKYLKMMTVVAGLTILNYTIGFLALLGFLLFMMEEYTDVEGPDGPESRESLSKSVTEPKLPSSSSSKPSSSSFSSKSPSSSSSSSTRPSSSSPNSRSIPSPSSSAGGSSSRRTITEEEKAALPTSTRKKEKASEVKPLPPISMMYLAQPDVKVPGTWKGPEFRMAVQGSTTPLMSSVYGP